MPLIEVDIYDKHVAFFLTDYLPVFLKIGDFLVKDNSETLSQKLVHADAVYVSIRQIVRYRCNDFANLANLLAKTKFMNMFYNIF